MSITNCTLTANAAIGGTGGSGQGGAVYSSSGGSASNDDFSITLLSDTFAGNTADAGGALYVLGERHRLATGGPRCK